MRNVAPSRALVRRSYRLLEIAVVVVAIGIFLGMVGLALLVVPLIGPGSSARSTYDLLVSILLILGVGTGLTGLGMAFRAVTWKIENDLAKQIGNLLAQHLDERYIFVRNIRKRDLGYIDAVLIGPAGVLVLHVVDYEGAFLNEAGKWLKQDKKGKWQPMRSNPTRKVAAHVKDMRAYFAERNLPEIPVFGIVVFSKDDPIAKLTLKDPIVPATHMSSLPIRLQEHYLAKERIEMKAAVAIERLLFDR
jgi:hypothetical protein